MDISWSWQWVERSNEGRSCCANRMRAEFHRPSELRQRGWVWCHVLLRGLFQRTANTHIPRKLWKNVLECIQRMLEWFHLVVWTSVDWLVSTIPQFLLHIFTNWWVFFSRVCYIWLFLDLYILSSPTYSLMGSGDIKGEGHCQLW
jgi:hypothetical protein